MFRKVLYFIIITFFLSSQTVDLNAQLYFNPDRHSTNSFDGWISCTPATNPNTTRGDGHWVQYELGHSYIFGSSHIWNINDPDNLDAGIKNLAIDYSEDGITWTELGVFNIAQSEGSLYYAGAAGPHFNNIRTNFLLFTAVDNYGANCSGFSEMKIQVIDPTLPLELISFNVNCKDQNNIISWTTEKELQIDKCLVQRSTDAQSWTTISQIVSNGDHLEKRTFEFTDISVQNNYYYRLEILDLSGSSRFSEIIRSDCDQKEIGLSIFPNPTNKLTTLSFNSIKSGFFKYKMYDIVGKTIVSGQRELINGLNQLEINTTEILAGDYFVHIKMGSEAMTKKLVVY